MLLQLLLFLFCFVYAEIWLLVWLTRQTNILFAIGLMFACGLLGTAIARYQGWRALQRIREQLQRREMPSAEIGDGVLIFMAGVLLILPGLLSDILGLLLLVPPVRRAVGTGLLAWWKRRVTVNVRTFRSDGVPDGGSGANPEIIDVEYSRLPPEQPRLHDEGKASP